MSAYYTATELAHLRLDGLPTTRQGWITLASRNNWPYRDRRVRGGAGGSAKEYPVAALPAPARRALLERKLASSSSSPATTTAGALPATSPSPAPAGRFTPCADLTDHQRLERDARAGVVAAIRRFQAETGCSQEAALHTLLTTAASGRADPLVVKSLQLARDGRGRKGAGAGLPSIRTLKRWLAAPDLTPRVARPDMSVPAWAPVFLARYQQPQKPSVEAAYRDACNAWAPADRPSIHQVRRFLDKIGTISRERGRMGPRELKNIRPYVTRSFDDLEPNDIWSADGHTFDAEVQHPFHGRPFRPEITTIIDIATRRIVGWSVDLAESGIAVLDALRHAAEAAGLTAIFYVDKGSGYDNALLKAEGTGLAGRMGFEVKHSIAYNSQARGVIERLHQTVWVQGAKLLPSYVGASMDREARLAQFKLTRQVLKKGGAMPLLPWDVFLDFARDRVAEYNARAHRSLKGTSPDLRWREFELKGWQAHRLASADLDTLFRPRVMRKLYRGRINLFTNYYSNNALEEFHGDRVMVAYDLHAVEKVWIYTPDGRYIGEAQINGNTRHYYPVPVVEQAREKRAAGREKRVRAKLTEIREELRGPALPAPGADRLVIAGPALRIDEAVTLGRALGTKQESAALCDHAATANVEARAADCPAVVPAPPRSDRPIADVVDEWTALDARITAGEAVSDDDAYWHGSVQRNPAWRAEMKRRQAEADAEGRRAAV